MARLSRFETLPKITKILGAQEAPHPTQPLGWIRPPGSVMDEGRGWRLWWLLLGLGYLLIAKDLRRLAFNNGRLGGR